MTTTQRPATRTNAVTTPGAGRGLLLVAERAPVVDERADRAGPGCPRILQPRRCGPRSGASPSCGRGPRTPAPSRRAPRRACASSAAFSAARCSRCAARWRRRGRASARAADRLEDDLGHRLRLPRAGTQAAAAEEVRRRSRRRGTRRSSSMRRCSGIVVLMPSTRSARRAPSRAAARAAGAVAARGRSASRPASRSAAGRATPRRRRRPSAPTHRAPRRPGGTSRVIGPGSGRKPASGSSALMRNSIACPRKRDAVLASGPAARPRRSGSARTTRSTPVTISVTGCSTCSRVFISMK